MSSFSQLATVLAEVEAVSSRLAMTEMLAKLYQQLAKDERKITSYLIQGQLRPLYQSLEFNLSTKLILRALAEVRATVQTDQAEQTNLFGENVGVDQIQDDIAKEYSKVGDVGILATQVRSELSAPDQQLSIAQVYQALEAIAESSGSGSQADKISKLKDLLLATDAESNRYITRIVLGKLRLGFSTQTLFDALSWAMVGDKSEAKLLEAAYQRKADVGVLAESYLDFENAEARQAFLQAVSVAIGIPVVPALCQRLNSAQEIIEKMTEVYAEPKYDGLRIQIHLAKAREGKSAIVEAFTRNLDRVTHMFPELHQILDVLQVENCIIDAEAIGYDPVTKNLLPFQETITRRRKHDVSDTAKSVPIQFYAFDILAIDDRGLLDESLRNRKDLLKNAFIGNETILLTPHIVTTDPKELRNFHEAQLGEGLEGAVMKQVDGTYQSGRKGWSWVKIKEAEGTTGKLKDTLDVVIMGYYFGRGKRTQFGLGALLVGVVAEDDTIKTIAKIGTGLTEEQLVTFKQQLAELEVSEVPTQYQVEKTLVPDVWIAPAMVIEVAADEITKSPTHTAGVALRFPRYLQTRSDKNWSDATKVGELSGF